MYILPMYSPMTPRLVSCMPPIKQMMLTVLDQPVMEFFKKYCTTDQITPMKLSSATNIPMPVINRMGLMLRLVMPSMASPSIFDSG